MNSKLKVYSYLYLVLCALCVVGNVYICLKDFGVFMPKITALNSLACILFAVYYTTNGYSKDAAKYYKTYMVLAFLLFQAVTVANAVTIGGYGARAITGTTVATNTLISAIFLTLALGKDMGKKLTYQLLALAQILTFINLVCAFCFVPGILFGGTIEGTVVCVRNISKFCIVSIACIMSSFKYIDKQARGTK